MAYVPAMKSVQAIRRFISTAWLVAAPLILLFGLIAVPIVLGIVSAVIERAFGPEAAERFSVFWVDTMMWAAELAFALTPIALAIYIAFRLAKSLARKKEP
jgi:hypothetical protein